MKAPDSTPVSCAHHDHPGGVCGYQQVLVTGGQGQAARAEGHMIITKLIQVDWGCILHEKLHFVFLGRQRSIEEMGRFRWPVPCCQHV